MKTMKTMKSILLAMAWSTAGASGYTALQLEALPGGTYTQASGINNAGVIDGTADDPSGQDVVLWSEEKPTVLQSGGGYYGFDVEGINTAGEFVGAFDTHQYYPMLWNGSVNAGLSGPVGLSDSFGIAHGINDAGDVVGGSSAPPCDVCFATLWPADGTVTVLPMLSGAMNSFAYGINTDGVIVGVSYLRKYVLI